MKPAASDWKPVSEYIPNYQWVLGLFRDLNNKYFTMIIQGDTAGNFWAQGGLPVKNPDQFAEITYP